MKTNLTKSKVCVWCQRQVSDGVVTIEHMIPKSRGGTNEKSNLKDACETCNARRGNSVYGNRKFHSFLANAREFPEEVTERENERIRKQISIQKNHISSLMKQIKALQNKRGTSNGVEANLAMIDAMLGSEQLARKVLEYKQANESLMCYCVSLEEKILILERTKNSL